MSSIDKLSIQGIRSFGPEDRDRQIVKFFHPLTLITGHNGAGKTSVIECLRYVTSGDMPPLGKGAAFIHDPKVAHETEVKGQVKLIFKDVSNRTTVVTRNLLATQKAKLISVKTMENVILRKNHLDETVSLSSKCAEIDSEMVASLGVSKPVLTSVIFCHQEESNWPLGEGRALKTRFDEIFAATRYIKAVESMTKFRKEQVGTIKEYQVEVKYLKQNKEKAKQLHDDCEEKQAQLSAAKDSVTKIRQDIVPIEERIRTIDAQDEQVNARCTELAKFKAEKKQMQRSVKDIEDGLENIFDGPVEELRRIYREHEDSLKEKQIKLKQNEKQLIKTRKDVDRIREEKSGLLLQQGKIEQEEKQHRDTVNKRNKKISKTAQELNISGYDDMGDDSQIQDFVKILDDKARQQEKEVTECKKKYEGQEKALDKQIQELRDTNTKLEHTIHMKTDSLKQNKTELKRIADDLSKMDATAQRLPELEEDLKRAERNLEEVQASVNVDELKEEIQQLQSDKKKKEAEMSKLSKEMSALSMQSKARAQMEMLQKEKNSKEDQIRKIRGRHEDEVVRLMGHFPTEKMRAKLSDFLVQKQSEVKDVQRKLDKAKGDMSSLKANRKMLTEQTKKLQDKLNDSRETLLEVCDEGEDLDQSVEGLQLSINNLQSEKGALTGSTHLFERYIRTLERQDAMCPLCHRGFDGQPEVDELVQELRDKLRLAPSKLKEKDRSLVQQREKLNKLIELKPVKDNVNKLSSTEIPEVKSKLNAINSSIEKLSSTISEQESSLSYLQEEERNANDMKPDIWQMDRCQGELKELERKIATQSMQLSGTDANRTIQQVNSERQSLELSLDLVSRTLDQKQQRVEEQTERVQILQVSINSITSEKLRLTMMVQQEEKLQEQQAELKSANQIYQREIKDAKDQLQPVQNRLTELTEEKNDVLMQKEADVEGLKFEMDKLRQKKSEITSLTTDINRYLNGGNRDKLESCQQSIRSVQEKLERLELQQTKLTDSINQTQEELAKQQHMEWGMEDCSVQQQTKLADSINQMREELTKQQVHERELSDNLQLRKKQKEVDEVEKKIVSLNEELAGIDTTSLKTEKRRLNNEYSKLFKEKNHADGRQAILHEDVRKLERELNDDMFKDAETKYQDMMIKLRTTEIANSDLEKYCKALDKAIMSYHSLKMSEVNKIIRDYWRTTYKGNDIDYIEIRSEDDISGKSSARKTYNYRVVMVKGDTALDMRGRCSAGQKVLASLIIRLALAETFCLNCGILALDEPTTNLDKDNIESLAHALVDIIKSREAQRNFQLIVITHDEDFVELLGRSDYTDFFYRITKNDEYKSVVRQLPMENLQAVTQ